MRGCYYFMGHLDFGEAVFVFLLVGAPVVFVLLGAVFVVELAAVLIAGVLLGAVFVSAIAAVLVVDVLLGATFGLDLLVSFCFPFKCKSYPGCT